jgi:hypothetical protein
MDAKGNIAVFGSDLEAREAGFKTQLTAEEAALLRGMNRHERRAALARKRCADRKAKKGAR